MVDAQVASTIDWPQSPQSPNHVLNSGGISKCFNRNVSTFQSNHNASPHLIFFIGFLKSEIAVFKAQR